ncbi:MAG: four helix bundle protein [Acidobacteriia bacterium]|nr:four helix bundle protein [Terriglobia bacterium]
MRKLDVYQAAVRFLPFAAGIADSLPPRYPAMSYQLRRASLSIPLNITEGSGKSTGPDQRRFYAMGRGSVRKRTNSFSPPLGCSRKCAEHENIRGEVQVHVQV